MELATAVKIAQVAFTAFQFVGGMQEASAQEAYGKQQAQIAEMQARNARDVAERNALIMRDQAEYTAKQQEVQAGQETAKSQRDAMEERRRKNLALSRATAVAAASGAGALDPTSLDIQGDITEQGELNVLNALFAGNIAASDLRTQAGLTRYEGEQRAGMELYGGQTEADILRYQGQSEKAIAKQKASSSRFRAVGSLFGGIEPASDLLDKYAPKKQTATKTSNITMQGWYQ